MSETTTREERLSALDDFAKVSMVESDSDASLPVPMPAAQAPSIVGAQRIAGDRRDVGRVLREISTLAAGAGENWFYRFPVKNKRTGQTEFIEGPSIKLAMAVMHAVGNIEVDTRVQYMGQAFMIYARAIDIEKGSAITRAYQQNIGGAKIGGADDGRRLDMALQIGQSKAVRNAVVALLETYTDFAFNEARNSIVERIERDPVKWRERTLIGKVQKNNIDLKRVEAVIGRPLDKWLAPDIARVIAMVTAIEDGMATMDETFPPLQAETDDTTTSNKLDDFVDATVDAPAANVTADASNEPPTEPSTVEGAATGQAPPQTPADPVAAQRSAITSALQIANNPQLTPDERIEMLDGKQLMYEELGLPASFVVTLLKTAADVAKGKLPKADAQRYLGELVK